MKVVLLTPFFRPDNYGGAVKVYESLCMNQSFETHIICPVSNIDFDELEYFKEKTIKIHRCSRIIFSYSSKSIIKRITEFFNYRRNIKQEIISKIIDINPDVIINGGVRWFSWMNKEFKGISPVLNYIHGEELSMKPIGLFGRWLFKTQNMSFSQVNLNICVSSYTSNKVKEISPNAKVFVLTNFVDTNNFYPPINKDDLKSKYDLLNKTSIICVCRLIKRKGVDDLLKSISYLIKEDDFKSNIVLNVCGSGAELKDLKILSDKLSISEFVNFHGFTEESLMLELIQASDIFAMPNKTIDGDLEGFGLVFLEANACGLPVIGGRSGGVIDAIEDKFSGYLVDPYSIQDISEKLKLLIGNPNLAIKMGNNGFERSRIKFSLDRKRKEFESILKNVVDGKYFE
jgi:phosphatidylinositol alpha-1,6-mannosyltransferase